MPLIVHSPHSGRPVKVRNEDIGRAVRDERGRIFYVLQRDNGAGHYGSPTRMGSEKAERAYDEKVAAAANEPVVEDSTTPASPDAPHDATGKRRRSNRPAIAVVWIITIAIAGGAAGYGWYAGWWSSSPQTPPQTPPPTPPQTTSPVTPGPDSLDSTPLE